MTTRVTLGIDPELAMKRFDPRRIISEEEQLIYLQGAMPFLIRKAREAANRHSVSYRGFRVGCAAYAYRPDAYYIEDRHKIFLGANLKPNHDKTRWPKVCAEQVAILGARSAGYTRVIGLVVAGEPQADEESGIISPTLHPCGECRRMFTSLGEIVRPDTLIATVRLKEDAVEAFTVADLLKIHGTER